MAKCTLQCRASPAMAVKQWPTSTHALPLQRALRLTVLVVGVLPRQFQLPARQAACAAASSAHMRMRTQDLVAAAAAVIAGLPGAAAPAYALA